MITVFAVGLGGAMGAILRWWIGVFFSSMNFAGYLSTLSVNLIGSFIIGLVFIFFQNKFPGGELLQNGIMVGLLGGFTTYSAFSLEVVNMLTSGLLGRALIYALITLIGCITAAFFGATIGRAI